MNFSNLEIDKLYKVPLNFEMDFRDSHSKMRNIDSSRASFSKKEKRNRKFFLKRSVFFVSICKQTGNIELYLGSDFLHIEIMQGGHFPLNQYSIKDIKSETFVNDVDFKEQNVGSSLNLASTQIRKQIKQMQKIQHTKNPFSCSISNQQRLKENLKENFTNIFDSLDWNIREKTNKNSAIETAKSILKAQHNDIMKILYQK
ncbi:unnamed protein product [Paramecium pentaurelia]|uniref:Uncharacterized protein n=1 Tax=Paramecium pentaurelia TaxID=43138 RepID=A0A8S1X3W8_9CILI|nr:unnamed protein product [Paramecium pentaurelia]